MKETNTKRQFDFPLYNEIDNSMPNITAIYLRASMDKQAQEEYGLDIQYDNIKKYITAFNIANPVIFVDDGYTGMNEERPAFQAMKTLMNLGRIKFVITFSLDRIGRTQIIILKFLKEQCEKCKCDFLAVKDNLDSRSKQTYGILISVLSKFFELKHDAIVAKLTEGRKQRASEGYWKGGGKPPYGYYYSRELNNLAVIPKQALTVKKVFEMYNTTEYSPRLIAEALGLSSDVLVYNILKNRTYLGEITFQGEQYQGLHQRIIDDDVFYRAQEILQSRSVTRSASDYLLSSIVYCGDCGSKMRYMKWGRGKSAKLKLLCYSKYDDGCRKIKADADCRNEIYDAQVVEEFVIDALMKFAIQYSEEIESKAITEEDKVSSLSAEYDKLKLQYDKAVKDYIFSGDEAVLNQAQEISNNMKRIECEIDKEREKKSVSVSIEERIHLLRTLPDTWQKMNAKQKQSVIRELVQKVEINAGMINIYLYKNKFNDLSFISKDVLD